jgi:hypothetical protein
MTEVCVKTWPSDVWTTKERLEVKEGFGAEEEVGAEEVFAELVEEGAALEGLDVVVPEEALEEGELTTGLEVVEGAAVVAGGDEAVSEVDVGVSLVGEAAVSVGCAGVVTGTVARGGVVGAAGEDMV